MKNKIIKYIIPFIIIFFTFEGLLLLAFALHSKDLKNTLIGLVIAFIGYVLLRLPINKKTKTD